MAGASNWLQAATSILRTRHHVVPALQRERLQLCSLQAHNACLRQFMQARYISLRSWKSSRSKDLPARPYTKTFFTHRQKAQRSCGIVHHYSSGAATEEVQKKEPVAQLAAPGTWLDRMPKSVQPYLYLTRIDKPIGTWLLFWPCGNSMHVYGTQ